jgi:hypothetical protein
MFAAAFAAAPRETHWHRETKTIGKGRGTIRPHPTRVMFIDDY